MDALKNEEAMSLKYNKINMQNLIQKILEIYPRREELNIPYGQDKALAIHGKHEIRDLFEELKTSINQLSSITKNNRLTIKSSYGAGGYAAVPWVAIMDTRITTSTQTGTYIVFLFAENGESCDLKIGQGVTEIQKEFKSKTTDELKRRAEEVRKLFPEMQGTKFYPARETNTFGSSQGKLYEASTILSVTYNKDRVPANNEIESDLNTLLGCYEKFVDNFFKDKLDVAKQENEDQNYMHSSSGSYGVQQIIDEGCFASSREIQVIIERLKSKKNIILQGPPGTGKTWLAKRLGYALIGEKDLDQLKAVQFHPNLSYEDFVRGWRPSGEGKLSLIDGPFMEAINKAKNSSAPYVVVIEEINRGNPAQIFGEMLTLLESNKRNADEGLELSYRKSDDERVYIPENLYVIGTMNIADRSLALVDLALRRRFAFIDLKPSINSAWKSWLVDKIKIPSNIANEIQQRMISLNDQISKDQSLGSQYQIGHSYVTPTSPIADPREWFRQVVQTEIYPLLNEYWFDNPDNAIKIRDQLLQDF